MQTLSDYLTMGGYAAFVWPAYGAAALILIVFAVDSWRRLRKAERDLRRLEAEAGVTSRQAGATTQAGSR